MADNVKVAVRVRPFAPREKQSTCIIKMEKNITTITNPETKEEKTFAFDFSYWSHNPEDPHFATQKTVFDDLGVGVLENAWSGYNTSLFAYGQTGSGKSYSMVGYGKEKGIIPCACEELFARITRAAGGATTFKVEASMMEIYNERVRDLFNPHNTKNDSGLKVRENPKTGPYVDGLALLPVRDFAHIDHLMEEGTKARTVASTQMNATSSRAHTIFTIILTQTTTNAATMKVMDKVSKVNLVDLAGSERATSTGAQGDRLKEGAAINKSLSALGNCISALAEASNAGNRKGDKKPYIPYRDSSLTWLLKESLGGNAKTIMIAALSPADINFDETLSTLRYADRAKQIKNVAVVNEDANEKLIRELKEEVERLRALATGHAPRSNPDIDNLTAQARKEAEEQAAKEMLQYKEQLAESQKLIEQLNKSWEQKIKEADAVENERRKMLEDMGLAMTEEQLRFPQLININEDRMKSGSIIYALRPGTTTVGRPDASEAQTIKLIGLNMSKEHCVMVSDGSSPAKVALRRVGNARTWVNGKQLEEEEVVLKQNDRVLFGNNHLFRFNDPIMSANRMARRESKRIRKQERQAKRDRKSRRQKAIEEGNEVEGSEEEDDGEEADETLDQSSGDEEGDETVGVAEEGEDPADWFGSSGVRAPVEDEIDWEFAQRELAMAAGQSELVMNAEKEMAEAEEMRKKMMALEEQLQKDREEAERRMKEQEEELKKRDEQVQQLVGKEREEAQKEFERQQEEMRRIQAELEEKLKAQEDEAGRMRSEQGIKRRENQIMNDRIVSMLPLVTEANMISEELDRGYRFELKIVPKHMLSGDTVNPMVKRGSISFSRESALAVRVHDTRTDASQIWTREKFMDRIYAIRDYYHRMVVGDDEDEADVEDPFFDEQESHLVGTSLVYLDSLYYLFDVDMTTPIIDYKGKPEGELRVKMTLVADEQDTPLKLKNGDFPDSIEPLKGGTAMFKTEIVSGRGLPRRMGKFFVRFQVAERYPMLQSEKCEGTSMSPAFNSVHYQQIVVDSALEQQLLSEALAFQVWGSITEAPPTEQRGPSNRPGGKAMAQLDEKNKQLEEKAERLAQLEEAILRRKSAIDIPSGGVEGLRMEVEEEEVLDDDEDLLLGDADINDADMDATPVLPDPPARRTSTEASRVDGWAASTLGGLKGDGDQKMTPRRLSQAMEEQLSEAEGGTPAGAAGEAVRPGSNSSWMGEGGTSSRPQEEEQKQEGEGAERKEKEEREREREKERERVVEEAREEARKKEEEAERQREREREAKEREERLEAEKAEARRLAEERERERQAAEEEAKMLRQAAEEAKRAREGMEAERRAIEKEKEAMQSMLQQAEEKRAAAEAAHRKELEEAAALANKERDELKLQLQKEQEYKRKVEEDMLELARIKEEMAVLKQKQAKQSKMCTVM